MKMLGFKSNNNKANTDTAGDDTFKGFAFAKEEVVANPLNTAATTTTTDTSNTSTAK